MIKILWSFTGALLVTLIAGKILVPALRRMKAGQEIREDGPTWHNTKRGTPTMGGIMFIVGMMFACLVGGLEEMLDGEWRHILIIAFGLIFAAIGFLDDYEKLKKKQNLGLTALQKFSLQLAAAIAFVLLLRSMGYLNPLLYIPFFDITWEMPDFLYFIFAAFVIVGCVNAVNITDGIDGLAAGVSIPVALCYTAVAFVWGYSSVGIFGAAMAGALVAFLVFNFHPAKVFMGDTGSLFLGGVICAAAFALDIPLVLIPLGIVYIVETLSDIIQVTYFKLTHGKRIFKMAPLHHHFEMCGWSEKKIFAVFVSVSAVAAVVSFFAVINKVS